MFWTYNNIIQMRKFIAIYTLAIFAYANSHSQVVINEIMQSNIDCVMDDLNEFPDSWLELYNSGEYTINVGGYSVGLEDNPTEAWALPEIEIPAGGYLLVYCDKAETELHTNFRIDSGKGALYLFDSTGNQIDALTGIKKQPAPNIAYGRESDGADKWGYELTPTPGAANAGGISNVILPEVQFSEQGRILNENNSSIQLDLYLPDGAPEGTYICYTLDGSEPTLNNGIIYNGTIQIDSSIVVRAKAFCNGCISIPSSVQSYIMLGREQNIPVISIVTDDKYLNDPEIGIFYNDPEKEERKKNYFQDWRRPINIEYFSIDKEESQLNQLAEMRIQGGATRSNPLKSLAIYANKRFGTKRFDYEFWHSDKPGVTDNKSFILRNGGNDFGWAYIRDALIQRVVGRNTDAVDWQGYSPAIVYINGNYYAMLAIRERSNEDNIAANYDGLEDIDLYENWSYLKAGTRDARSEFIKFLTLTHPIDEWHKQLDIESYCALMAVNYWTYNPDFPNNNVIMWRRREGDDTRWRFFIKDCDYGLGTAHGTLDKDFFNRMNEGKDDYSKWQYGYTLWHNLWANNDFKNIMADRLTAYCGDFLRFEYFAQYLQELYDETHGEQQISHDIWGRPLTNSDYDDNINYLSSWIEERDKYIPTLMEGTFGYTGHATVSVNEWLDPNVAASLNVTYANTPLSHGVFHGTDYVGRNIRLSSPDVEGWMVSIEGEETKHTGTDISIPVEEGKSYVINAFSSEIGGINSYIGEDKNFYIENGSIIVDEAMEVYDLAGRKVASGTGRLSLPSQGAYIIRSNGKATLTVDR